MAHARDAARLARRRAERLSRVTSDPRARDLLRRHLRGGRHRRGRGARRRRLLAGRARPLRRRRAGDRLAPPPRARQRRRRRRAAPRRGRRSTTSTLVAVTQGPGLVGALLVGVATAKGLAAARRLPLAPVDHLQGHVAANFLAPDPIEPPFLCLIASGGHTLLVRVGDHRGYEVLGSTLDDAAGEAFDKGARLLGLGLPGRAGAVEARRSRAIPRRSPSRPRRASPGWTSRSPAEDGAAVRGPRPRGGGDARAARPTSRRRYEHAIVEALIARVERALAAEPGARLAIGGGVAANRRLRARAEALGVAVHVPPPELCTDNAAMIALGRALGRPAPVSRLPRPGRLRDRTPQPRRADAVAPGTSRRVAEAGAPDRRRGRVHPPPAARPARDRGGGDRRLHRRRRPGIAAGRHRAGAALRRRGPLRRALAARAQRRGARACIVALPRPALGEAGIARSAGAARATCARSRTSRGALRSALGARGIRLSDVVTFTRTFNGFAATVRTSDLARPAVARRARAARAALLSGHRPSPRACPALRAAGGRGAARRRVGRGARHGRRRGPSAAGGPARPRLRRGRPRRRPRAGRGPARRAAGDERDGARRRSWSRAGERVLPIRVAGLQPARRAPGSEDVAISDQLLAGLERAVDPDGDGATDDHVRSPSSASTRPTPASSARRRRARSRGAAGARHARRRARRAGGRGRGPGRHVGSPAAAPAALGVGALAAPGAVARIDLRRRRRRAAAPRCSPARRRPRACRPPGRSTRPIRPSCWRAARSLRGRLVVVRAGDDAGGARAAAAAAAGARAVLLADPRAPRRCRRCRPGRIARARPRRHRRRGRGGARRAAGRDGRRSATCRAGRPRRRPAAPAAGGGAAG